MSRVFAVIPAAGKSHRMGKPKLLLPFGDGLIIDRVLQAWCEGSIDTVVVVCRSSDTALRQACDKWPVTVTSPPDDPVDMKASLVHGIRWLRDNMAPTANAFWMAAPADLPTLNSEVIRRVATEQAENRIVVPRFAGHASHPVRLPWPLAAELEALGPSDGLKTIIERNVPHYVDFPADDYASDVDTPADYQELNAAELIAQIESAFQGVQLGDGVSLNMSYYVDSCGLDAEYAELSKSDERNDWQKIPDDEIERFAETFSFTDLLGYRFYLPRCMIWTIHHHATSTNILSDYTIYALDPGKYQFESIRFVDWFSGEQLDAIEAFLRYCVADGDSLDDSKAKENLERIQSMRGTMSTVHNEPPNVP